MGALKSWFVRKIRSINIVRQQGEIDALYAMHYQAVHDLDESTAAVQTRDAFASQWKNLPEGKYLLSDPWFRGNVARIIAEEELQIRPEWFAGKEVLDAGCGNGRWSYGLASLGAHVTAVDVNEVAVAATRTAIEPFDVPKAFHVSPLEDLSSQFPGKRFDLVWCWGVLHHCRSFNKSLEQVARLVKPGGVLYLYLYGRESVPFQEDLELFKERVRYNALPTEAARLAFLRKKARGDEGLVHVLHDIYAPLLNRRFLYDDVKRYVEEKGFEDVTRTIDTGEVFVRAIKSPAADFRSRWVLPKKPAPYWFQHHA